MNERVLVAHIVGPIADRIFEEQEKRDAILNMMFMQVTASNKTVKRAIEAIQEEIKIVLAKQINSKDRSKLELILKDLDYAHSKVRDENADEDAYRYVDVDEGVYSLF